MNKILNKIPIKTIIISIIALLFIIIGFFSPLLKDVSLFIGGISLLILIVGNVLAYSDYNDDNMCNKKIIIILIPLILWILMIGISLQTEQTWTVTTEKYDIYHVDAPFGVMWRDTTGHFIFGCGNLNTDLAETYTVKYMIGSKLYTKQFDAENNALEVDGHFYLQKDTYIRHYKNWLWGESDDTIDSISYNGYTKIYYTIHIPQLPDVDGVTKEYKIVG